MAIIEFVETFIKYMYKHELVTIVDDEINASI